jgi:hypothetical protein
MNELYFIHSYFTLIEFLVNSFCIFFEKYLEVGIDKIRTTLGKLERLMLIKKIYRISRNFLVLNKEENIYSRNNLPL